MSLTWDLRTVLISEAFSISNDRDNEEASRHGIAKLGPIDVWNYLISLSYDPAPQGSESPERYSKLRHFKAADFDGSWDSAPKHLGDGASYSVDKCTLTVKNIDGTPLVVAVKKINAFKSASIRDGYSSAALQRSVAIILKELRILTHPPLESHPNIVGLFGYRSEFAPASSRQSTNVSLVVEYAPYGTLRDFCQGHSADKASEVLLKAHFMHDIASGLEALHKCGIVHGDVKLENTLVFGGSKRLFVAKLSDFGHSLVDLHTPEGSKQVYLGTPLLNAPEVRDRNNQVHGAHSLYKCDIYSFGLLAWELILCGAHFISTLGDSVSTEDSTLASLQLENLPKDELLLRSITSLKERHGTDEDYLIQVISRALQGSLRDNPEERVEIEKIVTYFLEHKELNKDYWMRRGGLSASQDKSWASNLKPFVIRDGKSMPTSSVPQMPIAVQSDLMDQLHYTTETAPSDTERRSALFDLAICYMSGVGAKEPDLRKALNLLIDAAKLGSPKALSLVFRIHEAVVGEIPPNLWGIDHSITNIERSLCFVKSHEYFVQRLRRYERFYKETALDCRFDILYRGEPTILAVSLSDVQKRLQGWSGLDLEHLECVSHTEVVDIPQIRGQLFIVAIRLGLSSLVSFLFSISDSAVNSPTGIGYLPWSENPLTAACRGGHLDVLKLLIYKGVYIHLGESRLGTPLHWLNMFELDEAAIALQLLCQVQGGMQCLQVSIPHPGVEIGYCSFSGTPIEFAIAANNVSLVEMFLKIKLLVEPRDWTKAIGWTSNTFPLAVSLNLYGLLPILADTEKEFRSSLWDSPTVPPMSLFNLLHRHDPLLPLMIHGSTLRTVLESTIDVIIGTGASYDGQDSQGRTVLSQAVKFAPCKFNTHLISALISRGVICTFGGQEEPMAIISFIGERADHAGPSIVKLLLEAKLLPLNTEVLSVPVSQGNTSIAAAVLEFEDNGMKLDANDPMVAGGVSFSLLFLAVMSGSVQMVQLLLDHGADIQSVWDDRTPLEAAINMSNCDPEIIDLLITRGATLVFRKYTILHQAAHSNSRCNGMHVLFHLLRHESVQELVNCTAKGENGEPDLTPLNMAVMSGNSGSVHALLQSGADVESGEALQLILRLAVNTGRRPQTSIIVGEKILDEEEIYHWRLDMENIILSLLNKGDPGHGRTSLHVAVELGNLRRVVELIERHGHRFSVEDRDKLLPGAYLEDMSSLQENGEEKEHVKNLEKLYEYLRLEFIKEICADVHNPDVIETFLGNHPLTTEVSEESWQATAKLEETLQRLKIERDGTDLSIGDGLDSPSEREVKLKDAINLQKQTLGETNLLTLRTVATLCEILVYQGKYQETEGLNLEVLKGREAQLPSNHPELFEALVDRTCILCGLGKFQEAKDHALRIEIKAIETFGAEHPITLKAEAINACTDTCLGEVERATEKEESILEMYSRISFDEGCDKYQGFPQSLLELKVNLAIDYCRLQKFEAAGELVRGLPSRLEYAKPKYFLQIFDTLIGLAGSLDACQQYKDSEHIYTSVVKTCIKAHGKKRSFCTRTALEKLSGSYRIRCMWEMESKTLQRLVDILKLTIGPEHPDTLAQIANLADSLGKDNRWVEAGVVLGQLLKSYELVPDQNKSEIAQVKVALCQNLRNQNQLERSEKYGWEALSEYRAELGDDSDLSLKAQRELTLTLSYSGKYAEAIKLLQQRVDILVQAYGEIHHKTRFAVENLYSALMRAKRFDEAEVQARRCLKIGSEIPETNDQIVSSGVYFVARCKEFQGDLEEAKRLYAVSIDLEKKWSQGVLTEDILTVMRSLANLHVESGEYKEAEPLLQEILAGAPTVYQPERPELTSQVYNLLGRVLENTDRTNEAIEHFKVAVSLARIAHGDSGQDTLFCLDNLVQATVANGSMEEASTFAAELLECRRRMRGEYHPETMETKKDLCFIYPPLGMWPEAERLQRDVLQYFEATGSDLDNDIYVICEALATSCRKQGFYLEAELFAVRAWQTQGLDDVLAMQATADLARIYAETGKFEQAYKMLALLRETNSTIFGDEDEKFAMCEGVHAYISFKKGHLAEAAQVQRQVCQVNYYSLEDLCFLMDLYESMGNYDEASKIARRASSVAFSESRGTGPEVKKSGLLKVFIYEIRLHTATGNFTTAKQMGTLALSQASKWHLVNYSHAKIFLSCLQALMPLYEILGDEENKNLVKSRILKESRRQEEKKELHLKDIQSDKEKHREFQNGFGRE